MAEGLAGTVLEIKAVDGARRNWTQRGLLAVCWLLFLACSCADLSSGSVWLSAQRAAQPWTLQLASLYYVLPLSLVIRLVRPYPPTHNTPSHITAMFMIKSRSSPLLSCLQQCVSLTD